MFDQQLEDQQREQTDKSQGQEKVTPGVFPVYMYTGNTKHCQNSKSLYLFAYSLATYKASQQLLDGLQ